MQPLSQQIPFHPLPYEGELFKGYILRLAVCNELDKLQDFVSAFDIPAGTKKIFLIGTQENERFMRVLTQSLGYEAGSLDKYFEGEGARQMIVWLSSRHTLVNEPTICPHCLEDQPHLKAEWHLYYTTHCLKHKCQLWNECPQCNNKFKWSGGLFKKCTSCGLQWKNVCAIRVSPPLSQIAIAEAKGANKTALVKRILSKMNIGLRPFDASFQRQREIDKYVPDLARHIESAYQLGYSEDAVVELKKQRFSHWQNKIGGPRQTVLMQQIDAANDERFFDFENAKHSSGKDTPIFKEASFRVLTSHRRLNTTPENACFELSWNQLEEVLLMRTAHLKKLIREGELPGRMHVNSPKKVSPSRLDDVVKFFRRIKKNSIPIRAANDDTFEKEFIAWGDERRLSDFKLKTKDLVKLLSSNQLQVYSPDYYNHGFDSFHFKETSLVELFGTSSANDIGQTNKENRPA
ncbi:TniQ family protein [Aliidiomarina shirensis]|nr:TniQ family protein [Aliidiomarina shirensis]